MRLHVAAALAAAVLFAACTGGGQARAPTPTPAPSPAVAPTATPTPSPAAAGSPEIGPQQFVPARALAHVEALSVDIGSRPAASDAEDKAAAYLRDQLQSFGYDAEVEPFSFDVFADDGSRLEILSPQQPSPAIYPFDPSANGVAEGRLVDAGIGRPEDFPTDSAGKVALIRRGTLFFSEKVENAAAAGAVGAVIFNDQPGLYAGQLSDPSTIPAVSLSEADGENLLDMVEAGPVSVRVNVRTATGPRDSQNVVARPPGGQCRVLAGGHYDSVPAGPGANDNASGTATVVEMARVTAADGELGDVCFALFGAEEVGLVGSARFVESLSDGQRDDLEAMLNFDMVGVGTRTLFIGSRSLTDIAAAEAKERGLEFRVDNSSAAAGSDHASFLDAGIPAVFVHSFFKTVADDPNYHTAGDVTDNVRATRMAELGEVGLALIDALLSGE